MFSSLADEQLTALRDELFAALTTLLKGEKVSEIRYGEIGRKFHPATAADCESFLGRVQDEIDVRAGCGGGGLLPVIG